MTIKKFFRTRPGQRVDQPDFEHVADATPRSVTEQIGRHVLTGSDSASNYVLEGFATTVSSPTITVDGGIAVVGYRDRGELRQGALATGGPASRSINISTYPAGTYNVYVTLVVEDAEFLNRPFWDSLASPAPVEVVRNTATRRTENWAIAVEATSPGDEWMRVAQVVKNGAGTVGAPTDLREFYFEGRPDSSPAFSVTDHEWGGGNDRNATRAVDGVKSLRKFVRAVQRQISSIIGGTGWWSAIPAGSDLTSLLANKLARNGSQTMTGNLLPDADNTRNIGASTTQRWANIYSAAAEFDLVTNFGRYIASASNVAALGGGRAQMLHGVTTGTSPNTEYRTIYQNENSSLASGPTIEIVINAQWAFSAGPAAYRWSSADTSNESFLYSFGRSGFRVYRRAPTATTWLDAVGGTGWTLLYRIDESVVDLSAVPFVATGLITPTEVTVANNAPTNPSGNTIYANNLVAARGTVTSNGSGGVLASTGMSSGTNFTATISGAAIRVTFNTAFSVSDSYQVMLTCNNTDTVPELQAKTSTYFEFAACTANSGNAVNLSTNSRSFDFIVVGG